ncbi:MAG: glycoside hydrolase family 6 protein [Solirubrobacteraceae bacterium]
MCRVLVGRWSRLLAAPAVVLGAAAAVVCSPLMGSAAAATVPAAAKASAAVGPRYVQQCPEPYSAVRDPSNPLALPAAPGADPLTGASFFVDGPRKGAAAGAIAQLLSINPPTLPVSESWASFDRQLQPGGSLGAALAANPTLAGQVAELSKIASQPEAQRFSIYSEGGGPGAIFAQAEKIFCSNLTADPGTIPIINTYFLHPALGGCPTPRQVRAYAPVFHRRVNEMAAATDLRPAVYLLELDAIGSSACIDKHHSLPGWEADLRYEINAMAALPHAVVYVEAGYSDGNSPGYTAKILNAIGISKIRGFFTNDTHLNWTINEVRWATKISRLTHGAHFVVNTADNGRGPLLNRNRVKNGNENLCNPPGRGLGPMDTTATGFPYADAFLWTHPPGNSSGCGGGPPGGVFWAQRAEQLAANANQQLGPGLPSRPY